MVFASLQPLFSHWSFLLEAGGGGLVRKDSEDFDAETKWERVDGDGVRWGRGEGDVGEGGLV